MSNCPHKEKLEVTVEDIRCGQCKKKFITQSLFEWHGCFLKPKGTCLKCGAHYAKKKALFKHYMACDAPFITPSWARDNSKKYAPSELGPKNASKVAKKKTTPARRMTSIKTEKELNVPSFTDEPIEDGELDGYDGDITYDNYGSDDDYSHSTGFEPQVDIQDDPIQPRIIDIKTEQTFEEESVQMNVPLTVDHIRKVKREQIAKQQAIKMVPHKNPFAVRVKQEAENGEQATVKVLNPFSNSATAHQNDSVNSKKVFKIPQALAMKIKKEKNQKSSVVVQNKTDEADADPEEEEQMRRIAMKIKNEKHQKSSVIVQNDTDEADADPEEEEQMRRMALSVVKEEKETKKSMVIKQLINPMAVAMREKKNSVESNSLIISAVSSISEEHHHDTSDIPASKMMTEIPAEFTKTIQHDEETPQQPPDSLEDDSTNILSTSISENNQIEDVAAVNNSNNDELDELLEKYGSSDIQDDDIQDLLKFD